MKKIILILLCCSFVNAYDFYVSPEGSDANSGSKDKPIASLRRAVERAQKYINVRSYPEDGITIYMTGGEYLFDEAVSIGSGFSGTDNVPVVIKAEDGAKVSVSGGPGFLLSEFAEVTDPGILKRLHRNAKGKVVMLDLRKRGIVEYGQLPLYGHSMGCLQEKTKFRMGPKAPELFFDGEPMTIARWPNEGFAKVGLVVEDGDVIRAWMDDAKGGKVMEHEWVPVEQRNDPPKGFAFEFDKQCLARWQMADDLRLYGYWYYNWSDQAIEAKVDAEKGVIYSIQPGGYGVKKGQRFYAYNLLEELDEPGEWYLDRTQGVLYLIPPKQDDKATLKLSLMSEPFVEINGASNVRIEGIDFGYTRGLGMTIKDAKNIHIVDCRVGNTGKAGIRVNGGYSNMIDGCEIFNNGSGGVLLKGGEVKKLTAAGHIVQNCHIYNYARIEKTYNPAISLDGVGNKALHNEVSNGAHLAVRFSGNNHTIEYNHIYDVCQETDDMAAIYAGRSWTSRGTVIRYNLIRDVTGYKSGTHRVSGIYLDDGISGTTVEGNIFFNVAQGLMFNGGRDNTAVNNVFFDVDNMMRHTNMRQAFVTWAAMSWRTLNKNIKSMPIDSELWKKAYPNLVNMLEDEPDLPKYNTIKDNLRYNTPIIIGKKGIQEAVTEYGTVENNIKNDKNPGSYDLENGRFNFDPASGVFDVMSGLKNIPTKKIGRISRKD